MLLHLHWHFFLFSDKNFGDFAKSVLEQNYAYRTRIRLGKRAKMIVLRVYRSNDEKITQVLLNSYVLQAVCHLEFAPHKSFVAQCGLQSNAFKRRHPTKFLTSF